VNLQRQSVGRVQSSSGRRGASTARILPPASALAAAQHSLDVRTDTAV
jgi:hypothetical protein